MDGIYDHERARWMAAARNKKSFLYWFTAAIPYLLIVIQVSTFAVSATHTAAMINLVAPERGMWGVVAFEIGLVIFSLLIYRTQQTGGVAILLWQGLEIIMALMIVLSNVAGSLDSVVRASDIKEMSFRAIKEAFGTLPLSTQLGLVIGFAFALGIPLLFIGTGQAFARLILDQSEGRDPLEHRWQSEGYGYVYRAFFSYLITEQKMRPGEARTLSRQLAAGYFGISSRTPFLADAVPAPVPVDIPAVPEASRTVPLELPTPSIDRSNGTSKRRPDAFQAAMDAYSKGLSKKEVIVQGIARKSTAYAAWKKFLGETPDE